MDDVKSSVLQKSSGLDLEYSILNPMLIDVGGRIKTIRKRLGLSQEAFGKLAGGVSKSAVSQWERGDTSPQRDALMALQKKRLINPDWIITGKGEPFLSPGGAQAAEGAFPPDLISIIPEWSSLPDQVRKHYLAIISDHARMYYGGGPLASDQSTPEKPAGVWNDQAIATGKDVGKNKTGL